MSFGERFAGAIRLSPAAFEDVEADTSSLKQALVVVLLSSVAVAVGGRSEASPMLLVSMVGAIVGWMLWSGITYLIGTTILRTPSTHADWGQLLRTTGFATAPGIVALLGIVRPLSAIAAFIASVWMLAAYVIAVRQALDYSSTLRALAVCIVGWLINTIVLGFFLLVR